MSKAIFHVIIPARYASQRLPGKALLDIAGKPMVQHVYERAVQSGAASVIIATDDERIAEAARGFHATVCMTAKSHRSGTERIAEVVTKLKFSPDTIVVNVQGDEPLISARIIEQAANNLAQHATAQVATLCEPIQSLEELRDPHNVKVVMDAKGFALYFSRAPIPCDVTGTQEIVAMRHVGLYAYRVSLLQQFVQWQPTPLEQSESLEQLRALWHGARIHVAIATEKTFLGVDTERDLQQVRDYLNQCRETEADVESTNGT